MCDIFALPVREGGVATLSLGYLLTRTLRAASLVLMQKRLLHLQDELADRGVQRHLELRPTETSVREIWMRALHAAP
jgi:hypothetical protein